MEDINGYASFHITRTIAVQVEYPCSKNRIYLQSKYLKRYDWSMFSLQTQLQAVAVLSSLFSSLISFSSFTFPDAPYQIFLLFLPWFPCHFNLVITTATTSWSQICWPSWVYTAHIPILSITLYNYWTAWSVINIWLIENVLFWATIIWILLMAQLTP